MFIDKITEMLGNDAKDILGYKAKIDKNLLQIPSGNFIDNVWLNSDRNNQTLNSLYKLFNHGRLAGTGYLSILPVDQGIEHSEA